MQGRYIEIHHHRLLSQEFSITLIYKRVFFKRRCVIKITLCCAVLSCSVMSDSVIPWTVVCQTPLSMGILLARIQEWVAMTSSMRSSWPRICTVHWYYTISLFTVYWLIIYHLLFDSVHQSNFKQISNSLSLQVPDLKLKKIIPALPVCMWWCIWNIFFYF